MQEATEILREEINSLKGQVDRERNAIAERQARLDGIEQTIATLETVLKKLNPAEEVAESEPRTAQRRGGGGARLKPADAVRHLLKDRPDGMTRKDIVAELDGRIQSNAPDHKRIIYNTLFNLKRRGTIIDDDTSGIIRLKPVV